MQYRCPSCFLMWKDAQEPLYIFSEPVCVFCSQKRTSREIFQWQMQHINDLDSAKLHLIFARIFHFFDHEIENLKIKIEDLQEKHS